MTKNIEWHPPQMYCNFFYLSEIGVIIFGRYSVFSAIVADEGSPVVVIQQGLHAKGGGDPKRGAKTCIAS